jgi:glutamyl/glutaminyl-tRNA synthetase
MTREEKAKRLNDLFKSPEEIAMEELENDIQFIKWNEDRFNEWIENMENDFKEKQPNINMSEYRVKNGGVKND